MLLTVVKNPPFAKTAAAVDSLVNMRREWLWTKHRAWGGERPPFTPQILGASGFVLNSYLVDTFVRSSYLVEDTFCAHSAFCSRRYLCAFSYRVEDAIRIPSTDPQAAGRCPILYFKRLFPELTQQIRTFFWVDPRTINPKNENTTPARTLRNEDPPKYLKACYILPKTPQSFRSMLLGGQCAHKQRS